MSVGWALWVNVVGTSHQRPLQVFLKRLRRSGPVGLYMEVTSTTAPAPAPVPLPHGPLSYLGLLISRASHLSLMRARDVIKIFGRKVYFKTSIKIRVFISLCPWGLPRHADRAPVLTFSHMLRLASSRDHRIIFYIKTTNSRLLYSYLIHCNVYTNTAWLES